MDREAFKEDLGLTKLPDYMKNKIQFMKENPFWFRDVGTLIFCGYQGSGKTLSAVNYIYNLFEMYPNMILVTNTKMRDFPFNAGYKKDEETGEYYIYDLETGERIWNEDYKTGRNDIVDGTYKYVCIEYDGLDCLKHINNGQLGVVYFVDEIHLELNSLESKNIDISIMVEISQQRKQRKKIIGTSQVFMRMAKPIREQVFDIVICTNYFGCFQFNKSIDGFQSYEENGKLHACVKRRSFWFHTYDMYGRYDTYAKMKRYKKEWKGLPSTAVSSYVVR